MKTKKSVLGIADIWLIVGGLALVGANLLLVSCQSFIAQPAEVLLPDHDIDPVKNRVVFIGSGTIVGAICCDMNFQCPPSLISMYFYFNSIPYNVVNAGIDGDTSLNTFNRIDQYLDPKKTYAIILDAGAFIWHNVHFVNGGTPDLAIESETIAHIIQKVQLSGVKLILLRHNFPIIDDFTSKFVGMYDQLGQKYKVPLIDAYPFGVFYRPDCYGPDHFHFNEVAYRLMAISWLHQLNPAFNPTEEELTVPNSAIRLMPWFQIILDQQTQTDGETP